MRDDAPAQGDEFRVAHIVLGIIGPPCADYEAPCVVGFEHVIDGRQQGEVALVGGAAQLGGGVVVGADQRPVQFFAGVEIMSAVVADGLVNVLPELLAGQFQMREPLAIPNEMRRRLAPQPANIDGVFNAEVSRDGVAAFIGHGRASMIAAALDERSSRQLFETQIWLTVVLLIRGTLLRPFPGKMDTPRLPQGRNTPGKFLIRHGLNTL